LFGDENGFVNDECVDLSIGRRAEQGNLGEIYLTLRV
jgi:hypothetical protein